MTESWSEVMERTATHIADMAQTPGWWDYCRDRVTRMEQEPGGLWIGLRLMVRAKLEAAKKGQK